MGPGRGQLNRALEQMKQAKPCNWANTLSSGWSGRNRALDERQWGSHGEGESSERNRVLGQKKLIHGREGRSQLQCKKKSQEEQKQAEVRIE